MIEIEIAQGEDAWYGACYRYETGAKAKEAWGRLGDPDINDGSWHVGVYRHQRIGLDKEPVLVSVVGDRRHGVEAAEISLMVDGGVETELHPETWLTLIRRRVEVVLKLDSEGAQAGRHRILHPPGGEPL